jgi:hypothetical protein
MRKREALLEKLSRENKLRENQLANLQLPQRLAERVKEQKLGLTMPPPGQMLWLPEPLVDGSNAPASTPALIVRAENK